MSPLRRGGAALAQKLRAVHAHTRHIRSYGSGHGHGHGEAGHGAHWTPAAEESMGTAFYVAFGAVPAAVLLYYSVQPGPQGEPSPVTKFLERVSNYEQEWEARNRLHTVAVERAAQDKHLFHNVERNTHVELKYPEVFQQGAPWNVPAGHYANMDAVVAHYRKQHLDEEERKAKRLAAKRSE